MSKQILNLLDVYDTKGAPKILYRILKQRPKRVNISHRRMPSWSQHLKFVRSRPYKAWYLLEISEPKPLIVGAIYLSKMNEIGIFLFNKFQGRGYGAAAVGSLMKKHKTVARFLANINPQNTPSIDFFKGIGFKHIQNTYERAL